MEWHLKRSDGSVYGPVDLLTLREWAADGRIAPSDQLSQDRQNWRPAPDVQRLSMDWNVELHDGSMYGPLNLLALRDLVMDGSVSRRARLVHKSTGKTLTVSDALLTLAIDHDSKAQAQIESLQAEVAKLRAAAEAPRGPSAAEADLQLRLKTAREEKEAVLRELQTAKQQKESREAALEAEIRDLKARADRAVQADRQLEEFRRQAEQAKAAQAAVADHERARKELEQANAQLLHAHAEGRKRVAELEAEVRDFRTRTERLAQAEKQANDSRRQAEREAGRAAEREAQLQKQAADLAALAARIESVQREMEGLRQRSESEQRAAQQQELDLKTQADDLRRRVDEEHKAAGQAQDLGKELQKKNEQLTEDLQALRKLHDASRQRAATPPLPAAAPPVPAPAGATADVVLRSKYDELQQKLAQVERSHQLLADRLRRYQAGGHGHPPSSGSADRIRWRDMR